ncbi:MAG: AarF/ABC1/UbiB kinase family protein [Myxococcales bacterium]|nr:AarF/ABC1/UbiB kinase family protein [Myxococcales bacterium]
MEELDGIKRKWGQRLFATGRIAASAARLATRRLLGSEGSADGELGEKLAKELDQMKGMAMKVGQIISYFDGILPEQTHQALTRLQQGIKPVSFGQMSGVIQDAFGAPPDQVFEDFEITPIASASIGQVYRAKWQGRPVAVKVQYPGVADTINSDFSTLEKFAALASLASAVDGKALVDELRLRFSEECDYEREAFHQNAFADAFAQYSDIKIPRAFPERTKTTVLTTEWCEGTDFYTFLQEAPQERRNEVGLWLARFAYQSIFRLGALNADPHPGNYLFPHDGPIIFLDFGCVRHFCKEDVEIERQLARVVVEDRREDFREAVLATKMIPRPDKFDFDIHWKMLRSQYAPYSQPLFRFTKEYLQEGMEYSRPSNPNLRQLAIPPTWIWLQRLQWGLHAVLARLQAEGDFASVYREALEMPLEPLMEPPSPSQQ